MPTPVDPNAFYTPPEIADLFFLSESAVHEAIEVPMGSRTPRLKALSISGRLLVRGSYILEYIDALVAQAEQPGDSMAAIGSVSDDAGLIARQGDYDIGPIPKVIRGRAAMSPEASAQFAKASGPKPLVPGTGPQARATDYSPAATATGAQAKLSPLPPTPPPPLSSLRPPGGDLPPTLGPQMPRTPSHDMQPIDLAQSPTATGALARLRASGQEVDQLVEEAERLTRERAAPKKPEPPKRAPNADQQMKDWM